jgi:hypothetical protein
MPKVETMRVDYRHLYVDPNQIRSWDLSKIRLEAKSMWRAFFYAVGIVLVVLGAECMVIDSAQIKNSEASKRPKLTVWNADAIAEPTKTVRPADWHPWSLLATGSIVLLYSWTIRRNG